MSRILGKKARQFLEREDARNVLRKIDDGRDATRERPREGDRTKSVRDSKPGARRPST